MCLSWILLISARLFIFDPSINKIYVSRHVQFVESLSPYKSLHSHLPRLSSNTADTWVSPILTVSFPNRSSLVPALSLTQSQELPSCNDPLPTPLPNHPHPTLSSITTNSPSPDLLHQPHPALASPPANQHPMITHAKKNIHEPVHKLDLYTHISPTHHYWTHHCYPSSLRPKLTPSHVRRV